MSESLDNQQIFRLSNRDVCNYLSDFCHQSANSIQSSCNKLFIAIELEILGHKH